MHQRSYAIDVSRADWAIDRGKCLQRTPKNADSHSLLVVYEMLTL